MTKRSLWDFKLLLQYLATAYSAIPAALLVYGLLLLGMWTIPAYVIGALVAILLASTSWYLIELRERRAQMKGYTNIISLQPPQDSTRTPFVISGYHHGVELLIAIDSQSATGLLEHLNSTFPQLIFVNKHFTKSVFEEVDESEPPFYSLKGVSSSQLVKTS
jgi:hypothetical protein